MVTPANKSESAPAAAPPRPLVLAGKVAPFAELRSLSLVGAAFGTVEGACPAPDSEPMDISESFERTAKKLNTTINFRLRLARPDVTAKSAHLSVEATYRLEFSLTKEFEDQSEAIDRFARINSLYNSWPYWREFVQNCTNRLGLPVLTLPLLTASGAVKMLRLDPDNDQDPTAVSKPAHKKGDPHE